ncbi:MAG TPA: hypothetical protein ENJ80_12150 [Gammaproteobacteria bacterium]|nr:hypothetical protein [Gammaproteobacteria bacterium]
MNLGALSLENAPGFWTPVRFFLTAPVFGMLAAGLIFVDGGQLLQSRWLPGSLAVAHAFTLGYIAMAMLGALFQMLPVLMGAVFPQAARAAMIVHLLMTLGTLCLVFAFLVQRPLLFAAAVVLLAPVLILFGAGVLVAIFRTGKVSTTARAVQLAALGLIVTVMLGGYMALGHAFGTAPINNVLTNYHAAWGVIGWILILAVGVSEQVIPMFLTTPPYPGLFNKRLAYLLMLLLVAGSLLPLRGLELAAVVLAGCLMLAYAVVTLQLLGKRRRKRFDITNAYWQVGMLCLVPGAGTNVYSYFGGAMGGADLALLSGLLLLVGFAVSIINGMLYKIVPFLVWLNLRMPAVMGKLKPGTRYYTPNIHEVINVRPMQVQLMFHVAGLLLLVAAVFFQGLTVYAAATAVLVSNLLLLLNLAHAVRLYRKYSSRAIAVR